MSTQILDQKISPPKQSEKIQNKALRIEYLQELIEKLNTICSNLDPYKPIPQEMKEMINEIEIVKLDDPFVLTNQLVVLLEDAVEELHSLDSGNPDEFSDS